MPNEENQADPESEPQIGADIHAASRRAVPIVGLGASAGGIEALTQVFDAMPADELRTRTGITGGSRRRSTRTDRQ